MVLQLLQHLMAAESVVIIGGADGPTSIYVASHVSPLLICAAALAVVAAVVIATVVIRKRRGTDGKKK